MNLMGTAQDTWGASDQTLSRFSGHLHVSKVDQSVVGFKMVGTLYLPLVSIKVTNKTHLGAFPPFSLTFMLRS